MPSSLKLLHIHLLKLSGWSHLEAPDAGEAELVNKSQFRKFCLRWELDHVSPGLKALHRGALGPGHLVLLPKAGLGSPCLPLRPRPAGQWCPPV